MLPLILSLDPFPMRAIGVLLLLSPVFLLKIIFPLPVQAKYYHQWQMGSEALGLIQFNNLHGIAVDAGGNI
jgi:TRAP-type mannitol/chloroaromatic compound transport system permease small subunit